MLPNTLNTNEVKNAAGSEVEFQHIDSAGRKRIFAQVGEAPNAPHRLLISHLEVGEGINRRRKSLTRVDKTSASDVDPTMMVTTSCYEVLDAPIGAKTTDADSKAVLAELGSFVYTTGAGTTLLFDGTGNGSQALLTGGL